MEPDIVGFTHEQSQALEDKLKAVSREAASDVHEHIDVVIKEAKDAAAAREKAERYWQVFMVALPVLLTVGLGFWVSNTQFNIRKQVEDNTRLLSTRLALREEFYRRRLTIYETTCKHLANLRESLDLLEQAQIDPNINVQAADNINAVDRLRKSEFLYMSDELVAELGDLWGLAVDRMRPAGEDGAEIMERITRQVSALEARMKADLQTREIGQVP